MDIAEYLETRGSIVIVKCSCGVRHFLLCTIPYWKIDDTFRCYTCKKRIGLPPEMFGTVGRLENPKAKKGMITWVR